MKNIPKYIFLQIGEDCERDDFNDIRAKEEVTWNDERLNDNDIKFELVEATDESH